MSARKAHISGSLGQQVTVQARETRLNLTPASVVIHKSGIEFRSSNSFSPWSEMTLTLESPSGKVHCVGVVISCTGNRHSGYHVSMVFTGLSKQAEARLSQMALKA